MSQRSVRPFSTISGVHPAYLPGLHKASRMEKKLVPAAVATVSIGYGIVKYKQTQAGQQQQQQAQAAQQMESSRQAEADIMMAAYGDRSSLAELEAAMKAYEQQRPQR
ncbi:hypothetical protein BJ166DRAFT_301107 [Pestalotiopsis sp. NC0098]|nr:hypothetical protein BJ166DRAFT_301107 [Pestalotiopsis sp. NC0098]KAI4592295.1 hypothetical protein KJ359_011354 [Pestalotiopsis sp. 9143b]